MLSNSMSLAGKDKNGEAKRRTKKCIGILYNIRSVHNVASMFRTADGAGITKLYLAGYTPIPFDRFGSVRKEFRKVALGAQEYVAWERAENISALLQHLRAEDFFVLAVEQDKSAVPLSEINKIVPQEKNVAFIVGNEVEGLSRDTLDAADNVVEIPMRGKKESLNVSVAFGIAAYWLTVGKGSQYIEKGK